MLQALVEGQEACATLQDAISIVKFTATFGKQTGLEPLGLGILQQAVAQPLHTGDLAELYMTLTERILQDQVWAPACVWT